MVVWLRPCESRSSSAPYSKVKPPSAYAEGGFLCVWFLSSDSIGSRFILPSVNKHAMLLHMQDISKAIPKGRHAVVVMDGASWHQPSLNQGNVTMLKRPPYSHLS